MRSKISCWKVKVKKLKVKNVPKILISKRIKNNKEEYFNSTFAEARIKSGKSISEWKKFKIEDEKLEEETLDFREGTFI